MHNIEWLFIRDIPAKFGTPNLPQSTDNKQKSDEGISDFSISGQYLTNKNWNNSRASNCIDIRLGLGTKIDKRITATS